MSQSSSTEQGSQYGVILSILLGLVAALAVGWFVYPSLLFSAKEQPVYFSHKTHMEEVGMACNDCHFYYEDGQFSGIPDTESCAECHFYTTDGESLREKRMDYFVTEYVEKGREVDWYVYQYQPDNVYFSHMAHKELDCTECHPDVGNADAPPVYYENRVTGYSYETMKMWECERCHAQTGASNACYTCHM